MEYLMKKLNSGNLLTRAVQHHARGPKVARWILKVAR